MWGSPPLKLPSSSGLSFPLAWMGLSTALSLQGPSGACTWPLGHLPHLWGKGDCYLCQRQVNDLHLKTVLQLQGWCVGDSEG